MESNLRNIAIKGNCDSGVVPEPEGRKNIKNITGPMGTV